MQLRPTPPLVLALVLSASFVLITSSGARAAGANVSEREAPRFSCTVGQCVPNDGDLSADPVCDFDGCSRRLESEECPGGTCSNGTCVGGDNDTLGCCQGGTCCAPCAANFASGCTRSFEATLTLLTLDPPNWDPERGDVCDTSSETGPTLGVILTGLSPTGTPFVLNRVFDTCSIRPCGSINGLRETFRCLDPFQHGIGSSFIAAQVFSEAYANTIFSADFYLESLTSLGLQGALAALGYGPGNPLITLGTIAAVEDHSADEHATVLRANVVVTYNDAPGDSALPGGSASPTCGDGFLDPGEECDKTRAADADCCAADCTLLRTEACTGGGCVVPSCGNGQLQPDQNEECDDGNTTSGDCCSSACKLETSTACTLLTQCTEDLDQCVIERDDLRARVADDDNDGIPNLLDLCAGTPGATAVDASGCSQVQFCARFDANEPNMRTSCRRSDWKNDEPRGHARDCTARRMPGVPSIVCMARP